MASAKQFLTTAIADNRTQMAAINDVAERTEAGVDPKLLIESLMSELAKATTRATKLEVELCRKITRTGDDPRIPWSSPRSGPRPTR